MDIPQFGDFYRAVHEQKPFRWQNDLAAEVVQRGWPGTIDVPTGLGKTSVLDIGVYALAFANHQPRRIFHIVNRRLVVDEAFDHAKKIEAALNQRATAEVAAVADRLIELMAADPDPGQPGDPRHPLTVARLRGGLTWAARWVARPDQPAVITGTVDQIGSRMLFRGYRTTETARPIDAALTFTDSLIILDEAHLAQPFRRTIGRIREMEQERGIQALRPVRFVAMSATGVTRRDRHERGACDETDAPDARTFRLNPDNHRDDSVAAKRLWATKHLHLVQDDTQSFGKIAAALAISAAKPPGRVITVFANTVAAARHIFDTVHGKLGTDRVLLLTGRGRPADRNALATDWLPRIGLNRPRQADLASVVVVATQTLEVGVNIDADLMIIEPPSIDALVQRLGRLNRAGESCEAQALLVAGKGFGDHMPVYGNTAAATWSYLSLRTTRIVAATEVDLSETTTALADPGIDVSPMALRELTAQACRHTRQTPPDRPYLEPSHVDIWAHTSPTPQPDLPVTPFLHGLGEPSSDVSLVWRAPLDSGLTGNEKILDDIAKRMGAIAPQREEMLEISVAAAQAWLTGTKEVPVADIDAPAHTETPDRGTLILLRRRDTWVKATPADIRSGDTVVVANRVGGCDAYGWKPNSTNPVPDLSFVGDRHVQFAPGILSSLLPGMNPTELEKSWIPRWRHTIETVTKTLGETAPLSEELRVLAESPESAAWPSIRAQLTTTQRFFTNNEEPRFEIGDNPQCPYVTVYRRGRVRNDGDDRSTLGSSAIGARVLLDDHHHAVAQRARAYAVALGLPDHLISAVKAAAGWHDLGKLDDRFQIMLFDGDFKSAYTAEHPLAKSGMDPADRQAFRRARILSGYPAGVPHEALSAALAQRYLAEVDHDLDEELVVHLIAAHHGRSRCLQPAVIDPDPREVTTEIAGHRVTAYTANIVDWDAPARFARLHARYGWYGLALLETIVRLADITCSAEGR